LTKVTIYSADWCPFCVRAKRLLDNKGVKYEEVNVDQHPGAREEVTKRTGHKTIPQIFIGEEFIGGFSELSALEGRGELEAKLGLK